MDGRSTVGGVPADQTEVTLRAPGPGELGWIVARHGALYAEELGWGVGFEALVAKVIADFAAGAAAGEQRRERAWIAEAQGAPAGYVLCVAGDAPGEAKLRLLLVEPFARRPRRRQPAGRRLHRLRA